LDPERGDQLTVENIAFESPVPEAPGEPGFVERYGPAFGEGARVLGVLLLALAAVFFVLRPMVLAAGGPRVLPAAAGDGVAQLKTVEDLEGELEAQLNAAVEQRRLETARMPLLTKKANALVQEEPESAAKLLRAWLAEDERR